MDEKGATPISPMAPVSMYPRSTDEAYATSQSDELRRKKRLRLFAYVGIFAVFQTVVILVFALVVMRVKTPDVEVVSAVIEGLSVGPTSFNMTLIARLKIKNKNFGDYKYERTTMNVTHGGVVVGEGVIWKGKAKARDTETVVVAVTVRSDASGGDTGTLTFESNAALTGKVHLMKMWGMKFQFVKKRRGAKMNCVMGINVTSGAIQNLDCDD